MARRPGLLVELQHEGDLVAGRGGAIRDRWLQEAVLRPRRRLSYVYGAARIARYGLRRSLVREAIERAGRGAVLRQAREESILGVVGRAVGHEGGRGRA